jgi:hypothetical protein
MIMLTHPSNAPAGTWFLPGGLIGQCEQFCTNCVNRMTQFRTMSHSTLYWWADRCARLARNAIGQCVRTEYETQERAWRTVAELMEVNETAVLPNTIRRDQLPGEAVGIIWWALRSIVHGSGHSLPRQTSQANRAEFRTFRLRLDHRRH